LIKQNFISNQKQSHTTSNVAQWAVDTWNPKIWWTSAKYAKQILFSCEKKTETNLLENNTEWL